LVLFEYGAKKIALEIAKKVCSRKSFEPKVQYHLAMIYKSNNEDQKVAPIKGRITLVFMN
jgi:predicted fused transcriptional regulator/phosphomethylpyrimidine kinase